MTSTTLSDLLEGDHVGVAIGNDRLLGISHVQTLFGCCPVTASRITDETGAAVLVHRKKYVLESSLLSYVTEHATS